MDLQTKRRIFSESVNGNRETLIDYVLTLVDRQCMANGSGTIFKTVYVVLFTGATFGIISAIRRVIRVGQAVGD